MGFFKWVKWFFWDSVRCEHELNPEWLYWDAGMIKTRHCKKCGRCMDLV